MAEQKEHLGQQVGEYRLFQQLGRGSFGAVYLAEHLHDHSQAAVKLLRLQLTSREDLKDFLNEARTMMRLRHPHIVPLLDFGLTRDDTPYLVMEYAAGGTLRQRYPKGTKLPLATIDSYVMQLASALQYAHDHRVIHRDVKPENVLLRADGTILLSDFGIAKVLEHSSLVSLHTQVGTPAYMAPEQSQGKPCPPSDQYALAAMVYEWLAGRLPFQGAPLEVMLQHRVDAPPSLQRLCPELSIQVDQVVLQAMKKNPEERFHAVEQFAQTLQTALHTPYSVTHMTYSTEPMTQPNNEPPDILPTAIVLQPSIQSSPSPELSTANDQVASPILSNPYLPEMIQLTNTATPPELPSGSLLLPEISSAPIVLPHSHNSKFSGRTLLVILLCFILLAGLAGGGAWTVLTQQHLQVSQRATATVQVAHFATATATTNLLPKPTPFKFTSDATMNISMQYPSDWTVGPADQSSDPIEYPITQPGHLVRMYIARFSSNLSSQISGPDQLNSALIGQISQQFSGVTPIPIPNANPTIGSDQWMEQDATYMSQDHTKGHFTTMTVLHNHQNYYNINFVVPESLYQQAMQEYIQPMLISFKFIS